MMCRSGRSAAPEGSRGGFTLIEMIVTIAIVIFMVGLTLSATSAMARGAEVRRTEDALRLLDMAFEEWQLQADRRLSWGPTERAYDVWSHREHVLIISEMLLPVLRNKAAAAIVARIDPDMVYTYDLDKRPAWLLTQAEVDQAEAFDGSVTILDAWGHPIYATHPGGPHDPASGAHGDADGTERTANEKEYGIARNRRVCFVSAGPDGLFGLAREFLGVSGQELDEAKRQAALDNLYSYEPDPVPSYGGG